MPTFKLDGRDVEFRPGEMIIEAAARAGVNIP
jgi:NADH dehydrogenase/NADH:ubiquinone oxidoreductase subunit G